MTKRVLVCDDLEDTRVLLAELLRVNGYDVVEAENGAAAIDLLRGGKLDAALIDLGLPDMSGLDVARAVREHPQRARLIALTGYANIDSEARAAGFDEHLLKPVTLPSLLKSLDGA